MANRSDFLSVLPRSIKKTITMGAVYGYGGSPRTVRKQFIDAHRAHKAFKTNRKYTESKDDGGAEESTVTS